MKSCIKVLVVASGGGHWLQLSRLWPAWQGTTVVSACAADAPGLPGGSSRHVRLRDATRWDRWGLAVLAAQTAWLVARERPQVIITTGAAPGLLCLIWGRCIGARTVWIDSLANVEGLSAAGRIARWVAQDWWTQWPHVAQAMEQQARAPLYKGATW